MHGSSLCHLQRRVYRPRPLGSRAQAQSLSESLGGHCVANKFVEPSANDTRVFSGVKRWIVFSDLHVHQRFDPYWLDSLNSVSKIATEHNAGCIFLVRDINNVHISTKCWCMFALLVVGDVADASASASATPTPCLHALPTSRETSGMLEKTFPTASCGKWKRYCVAGRTQPSASLATMTKHPSQELSIT